MISDTLLQDSIATNVNWALLEDCGDGDITAQLIGADTNAQARILTRQPMRLAGRPWVDAIFNALDERVALTWHYTDGQDVPANAVFLELSGPARSLLTGERAALNFIQTLSGIATRTYALTQLLTGLNTQLLDTRKTVPGLRIASKYAVTMGGGYNHRLGLFDAFLIKENHIAAAGGIAQAVTAARQIAPGKPVEVEVESFAELEQALAAGADVVMLDNFSLAAMQQAVGQVAGRCKLEASGNITAENLRAVAETGVDYISMGTLTKDIQSIDLSMRIV